MKNKCIRYKVKPTDLTTFRGEDCDGQIVFLDDVSEVLCKVYNDGGHYIAVPQRQSRAATTVSNHERSLMDDFFDVFYYDAVNDPDVSRSETASYIEYRFKQKFPEIVDCSEYVQKKIERARNNLLHRKKLCRRKAYLAEWNYWVTITYDDTKHDEQSFIRALSKCLSNLSTRRGWRYIGVYEQAPVTHRRHFHALMYIPEGEMIGDIREKTGYSTRLEHNQTIHENTFFAESFGRNDFEEVNQGQFKGGGLVEYMLKYIEKSGERIKYSRGLKSYIYKTVKIEDFSAPISDEYCVKFVLFDDVIVKERDIRRVEHKQLRFRLCKGVPQYAVSCIG